MSDGSPAGFREEARHCLREIEEGARGLHEALRRRRTDDILRAVEAQERALGRLDRLGAPPGGPAAADEDTRRLAGRTRRLLESNRVLAKAFLDVMSRTLDAVGAGRAGTYDAGGRPTAAAAPRLLQRTV
jgi:hypothetical protein